MIERYINGIKVFENDVFPNHAERFQKLADGQQPPVLLITCSDSRIVPALLTQSGPGDLFVLRNAGNIVPPYGPANGGEAAAIEYAVAALNVSHVVVCGHSRCGAMQAVLDPPTLDDMPAVRAWIQHVERARTALADAPPATGQSGQADLDRLIELNVLLQLDHLRTHPTVAHALAERRLELHGWVYRFETGEILTHSSANGCFEKIAVPTT
jgi:carbonic anhydrase